MIIHCRSFISSFMLCVVVHLNALRCVPALSVDSFNVPLTAQLLVMGGALFGLYQLVKAWDPASKNPLVCRSADACSGVFCIRTDCNAASCRPRKNMWTATTYELAVPTRQ